MPATAPRLSVVIPTRNEAESLDLLWRRLDQALAGLEAEVCFVDDSDDDTASALAVLEAESHGRVRCLFRQGSDRSGGLSTAVVEGLRMARGEFVCVMDADLQHPPETIPTMLAAAEAGADLVVASRYLERGSSAGLDGLSRRVVSRGAGLVARLLFTEARRSTDPLSGFFLCRRSLLDGIEFRPVGFKILLELLVCVPQLRVRDVPLDFQRRAMGSSKAGLRQGLLYFRHLFSLFFAVDGSARLWKFGLVGLSGLCLFLPILEVLTGPAHLPPLLAFLPAFCVSFAWNSTLNRLWTFADQRRRSGPASARRYLERALASGVVMFAVDALLLALGTTTLVAGLLAALVAMAMNALINWRLIRLAPSLWAQVAIDEGVRASLGRLAAAVSADRAYVLPPRASAQPGRPPQEMLERVGRSRRASLWTEAASYRPQRRSNIGVSSFLLLPVVTGGQLVGIVVGERGSVRGFDAGDLETGMHAVTELAESLAGAGLGLAYSVDAAGGQSMASSATP
jgi:dolichol-phosphate mannosyltransferase